MAADTMARLREKFVDCTKNGVAALNAAISRGRTEPERAAFVAVSTVNVAASLMGWRRLEYLTKPVAMPALAGRVSRSRASISDKTVGMVGLAGGVFGDVALLGRGNFTAGAAGFSVNHAAYCWLLWNRVGATFSRPRAAVRLLPLAAAVGLTAWKKRELLPVVALYGPLLATTSTLAADDGIARGGESSALGLRHGGNLFVVSDCLLLVREAVLAGDSWPTRIADAGVMSTYLVAQMLLVDGIFDD